MRQSRPPTNIQRKARIGIIGTGKMAFALGKAFLAAGHFVAFGSRKPETKNQFHEMVGDESKIYGVQAAIDAGQIIIITIPYSQVAVTVRKFANSLKNKVVIDITNPFTAQPNDGSSGAQVTARIIGEKARVVAAFKTNFAETISEPKDSSDKPREVHYAGDDQDAKDIVAGLIEEIGFSPVDCGTLAQSVTLDHMVPLMIRLDESHHGTSRKSSWRIASP